MQFGQGLGEDSGPVLVHDDDADVPLFDSDTMSKKLFDGIKAS